MAWDTGKPIYDRLPGDNEGYRKDQQWDGYDPTTDVALWLTEPWDSLLMELKGKIDNLPITHLDPAAADPENLDWLAQLCGFTGEYWQTDWAVLVKRQLIANSLNFIWINKGTRPLLEWLISLFGLQVRIYLLGEFLAGINAAGDLLGGDPFNYYLLVKLAYLRNSPEWALVEKLNKLYGPVFCESRVCYEQFYAGFSVAGDPVFV